MGDKDLQEVVGHFVELINLLDVGADDGLLLLEDADGPVHFHVHFVSAAGEQVRVFTQFCIYLLILEVFQGNWYLVLALLVKYHFEGSRVVVDLEQRAHRLLGTLNDTAYDDDLTALVWTFVYFLHR